MTQFCSEVTSFFSLCLVCPVFLFLPLYLTRSVSHPEEIKNADDSWAVTVTVL